MSTATSAQRGSTTKGNILMMTTQAGVIKYPKQEEFQFIKQLPVRRPRKTNKVERGDMSVSLLLGEETYCRLVLDLNQRGYDFKHRLAEIFYNRYPQGVIIPEVSNYAITRNTDRMKRSGRDRLTYLSEKGGQRKHLVRALYKASDLVWNMFMRDFRAKAAALNLLESTFASMLVEEFYAVYKMTKRKPDPVNHPRIPVFEGEFHPYGRTGPRAVEVKAAVVKRKKMGRPRKTASE